MKTPVIMILSGISAIGLLGGAVGYGVRSLLSGGGSASAVAPAGGANGSLSRSSSQDDADSLRKDAAKLPRIPHRQSEDTIESLLALDPASSYGRAAAWLADAGEEDIAAYWAAYQGGRRTNDMTDLIFLNWTRVNPRGAIAAMAGSPDEHYAWWAWAAHDPKGALAEAMATNPDRVNNVTWGLGEFHPEWLRENFDKLPEHARSNAIRGMMKWPDRQDPEGSLDFMKEHGERFDRETFLSLVRKDPWAAQDWVKRNSSLSDFRYSGDGSITDLMVTTIARERPEDLQRMMAATPAGETRRKMEDVIYQQLLADDPEAALEAARKGEVPLTKVQQLAHVGIKALQKDPEQAFALGAEMLEAAGGKLDYETRVEYENGSSSSGSGGGKGSALLDALFTMDPARTLGLIRTEEGKDMPHVARNLLNRWSTEDLTGLSEWTNSQTDPVMRHSGATYVMNGLAAQGEFAEAIEWAEITNPNYKNGAISSMVSQWSLKDEAAVREWVEQSSFPEEQKNSLREMVDHTLKSNR